MSPIDHHCALEGSTWSRKENRGFPDVPEVIGLQGQVCWPLLLWRVEEAGGRSQERREKDTDAVLGCVCKIISSFNWRIKSFGQNKIT